MAIAFRVPFVFPNLQLQLRATLSVSCLPAYQTENNTDSDGDDYISGK